MPSTPVQRAGQRDRLSGLTFALGVVHVAVAFGWRTARQWRQTGDTGFRLSRATPARARQASTLITVGAAAGVVVPALAWTGSLRPSPRFPRSARLAGVALLAAAVPLTARAQLDLGASWRIGVDESERIDLVTTGLFAAVRNPTFTGMSLVSIGAALAVPTPATVLGAAALLAGVELQVRTVEEPYLRLVHGDAYQAYPRAAGRFRPRLGRRLA